MQNYTTIVALFIQYSFPHSTRKKYKKFMDFLLEILLLHSLSLPNTGSPPGPDDSTTSTVDGFSGSFLLSVTVHYHHIPH